MKIIRCLALTAAMAFSAAAPADENVTMYPTKPVRVIVPFPPGGGVDVIARTVSQQLGPRLGQTFIVDNRPGASGNIGVRAAINSAPDGYTLLLFATVAGMFPLIHANLGYDPFADMAPISSIATQPLALFTTNSFPAQSVADLVRLARETPGKYAFAGIGVGSPQHMAGELLMYRTGVRLLHVPYKGTAPAITDLISGQTQFAFLGLSSGLPFVKSGKLKVLAVASKKRSELAPDLQTMEEAGVANFDLGITYFMAAPPGTPPAILKKLNAEIGAVLKEPAVIEILQKQGYEVTGSSAEHVLELLREENRKWAPIVKAAGIKVE
ncbi:MAG: hypothetical protein A3E79_17735 [Burkholderiales bacterium RIFCSPHIGHO2_12_FULL_61_11]|nr:MAG: hypothetical protein A3E79_17735 [Burkholderiales bacterium RIFCSPHIGHO2_12_FULL_61_11]